jgi:hypothetical protein
MSRPFLPAWRDGVLGDDALSHTEVSVAFVLAHYANSDGSRCRPGRDRLAKDTRLSERTVTRALSALEKRGWVVQAAGGYRGQAVEYVLSRPERETPLSPFGGEKGDTPVTLSRGKGGHRARKRETEDAKKGDTPVTPPRRRPSHRPREETRAPVVRASRVTGARVSPRDDPPGFAGWWDRYPRKVARAKAAEAYARAAKEAGEEAVCVGLVAWCAYWTEEATPERFVPHPTTWLNQRRWQDAPPSAAGTEALATLAKIGREQGIIR